jgi:jumonji domain-containing protein 7
LRDYYSFNPSNVEIIMEEPTPLEFMRFVARNRPFVIRGGATSWAAYEKWNAAYLVEKLGDTSVNVAVTPKGNADSPLENSNGEQWFVKPFEKELPFNEVLEYISCQEKNTTSPGKYHIHIYCSK